MFARSRSRPPPSIAHEASRTRILTPFLFLSSARAFNMNRRRLCVRKLEIDCAVQLRIQNSGASLSTQAQSTSSLQLLSPSGRICAAEAALTGCRISIPAVPRAEMLQTYSDVANRRECVHTSLVRHELISLPWVQTAGARGLTGRALWPGAAPACPWTDLFG